MTVSPSKAPGMPRSSGVLALGLFASVGHGAGGEQYRREGRTGAHLGPEPAGRSACGTAARGRAAASGSPARAAAFAAASPGAVPWPTAAAPACQIAPARSGSPSAWAWAASGDHVGELGDGGEVAQLRQPGEAERVEPVAGEQREVGVVRAHDAAGAVVLEVALDDRLHEQRVVGLAAGGARAGAARSPRSARARRRRRARRRAGRRPRAASAASASSALIRISSKAAAAASSVRVEVLGRVGERREPRLELRRRRVDAAGEQRAAPGAVGLRVAGRCAGVVAHRLLGEEDGQEARGPGDLHRPAAGGLAQPVGERLRRRGQPDVGVLVELGSVARPRRRRAGSRSASRPGRRRRPGRSGSSGRPGRRRPRREAAADDLAHDREVGRDADAAPARRRGRRGSR